MIKDECITAHKVWAVGEQNKKNIRAKRSAEKLWNKTKKKGYVNLWSRSDWMNSLQEDINLIARLIDKGSCCISSLQPCGSWKENGGHRFSVKAHGNLRFHLMNIHMQSYWQNHHQSGNPDGYDIGLETLYGSDYRNEVHALKLKYPVLKLTVPELMEAKKIALDVIKDLRSKNLVYSNTERINLRKKLNLILCIYK